MRRLLNEHTYITKKRAPTKRFKISPHPLPIPNRNRKFTATQLTTITPPKPGGIVETEDRLEWAGGATSSNAMSPSLEADSDLLWFFFLGTKVFFYRVKLDVYVIMS
jgi:hypothetical protein